MSFLPDFSRRGFIRLAAAAPLLGQIAAKNAFASAATALGKDPRQNVYTRLGVKTIINCRGTWTYLSGSLEFPEVQAAQREASEYFVNMFELQHAASRRLAGRGRTPFVRMAQQITEIATILVCRRSSD